MVRFCCKVDEGGEPSRFSYWPPPYLWSSKGYNMGPWTPDNEDWFLGRFKSYAKGEGRLHSIDKWSKKMKGIKDSTTMMNTLNNHCATFITT